LDQQQINDDK